MEAKQLIDPVPLGSRHLLFSSSPGAVAAVPNAWDNLAFVIRISCNRNDFGKEFR
jgi:hypothetical protein